MVLRRIHPDDRDNVLEYVDKAFQERREYFAEFRIVLSDGTVRHIQAVGHPVLSASGEVVEVVGTHVDVTERRRYLTTATNGTEIPGAAGIGTRCDRGRES